MQIPTVKISDGDGGYIIINETDFDEKNHQLFDENPAEPIAEEPAAETPKRKR